MPKSLRIGVCSQLTKGLLMERNTFFAVYAVLKLLKRAKTDGSAGHAESAVVCPDRNGFLRV